MDCLGLSLRLVGDSVRSIGTIVSNLAVGHPSSSLTLRLWSSEGKRMGMWLPAKVPGKLGITDLSASLLPDPSSAAGRCCVLPSPPSLSHAVPSAPCASFSPQRRARAHTARPSSPVQPAQAQPSRPPSGGACAGARGRSGAGAVPEVTRRPREGGGLGTAGRAPRAPRAELARNGPGPFRGGLGRGPRPAGEGVRRPNRAGSGAQCPASSGVARAGRSLDGAAGPHEPSTGMAVPCRLPSAYVPGHRPVPDRVPAPAG